MVAAHVKVNSIVCVRGVEMGYAQVEIRKCWGGGVYGGVEVALRRLYKINSNTNRLRRGNPTSDTAGIQAPLQR